MVVFLICLSCLSLLELILLLSFQSGLPPILLIVGLYFMNFSNLGFNGLFTDRKIIETFKYCNFYKFYPISLHLFILSIFYPLFRFLHKGGDRLSHAKPFTKFLYLLSKIFNFHAVSGRFGNKSNHWPILQMSLLPKTQG